VKTKFKNLLHQYKVEAFKSSHSNDKIAEHSEEIGKFTEDVLNQAHHYQFHKNPDKDRLEIINMIKNFTNEALLPPVIEKIMHRVINLECQHREMVKLVDNLLEVLSEDEDPGRRDSEAG